MKADFFSPQARSGPQCLLSPTLLNSVYSSLKIQLARSGSMTEAELVEAWGLFLGNSQTALGLYLSVLTGYLIIAYLVGNKLTRTQVVIVTILYVCATTIISLWFFAWWSRALASVHLDYHRVRQRDPPTTQERSDLGGLSGANIPRIGGRSAAPAVRPTWRSARPTAPP